MDDLLCSRLVGPVGTPVDGHETRMHGSWKSICRCRPMAAAGISGIDGTDEDVGGAV